MADVDSKQALTKAKTHTFAAKAILLSAGCNEQDATLHIFLAWLCVAKSLGLVEHNVEYDVDHNLAHHDDDIRAQPILLDTNFVKILCAHPLVQNILQNNPSFKQDLKAIVKTAKSVLLPTASAQPLESRLLHRQMRLLQKALRSLTRQFHPKVWHSVKGQLVLGSVFALVVVLAAAVAWVFSEPSQGFLATYFADARMENAVFSRQETHIDHVWGHHGPRKKMPMDFFSARYDSCLLLEQGTDILFRLGSDDGSRLFLNAVPVIEQWHRHSMRWAEKTVHVPAGTHHLRIEYFEAGGTAAIEFQALGKDQKPLKANPFFVPNASHTDALCD